MKPSGWGRTVSTFPGKRGEKHGGTEEAEGGTMEERRETEERAGAGLDGAAMPACR